MSNQVVVQSLLVCLFNVADLASEIQLAFVLVFEVQHIIFVAIGAFNLSELIFRKGHFI
jgi:hypothetical protein